ncbi:CaiB/BaiF CoA transferase family protein [Arthrobacter sp. B6]|uniref:CaiB/BaiF CoA transferase family protein n=1 Tax=Arthrobacter sp. B6 TaxID=1570137 RepID=UPI000832A366|nr:CaiB/BaiF CoA-transferase family protein [Arthrobacter sp. B6]
MGTPPIRREEAPGPQGGGPLEGIRVLELGSLVAGPFAGRLLADMGAEVIKIETSDRPDPLRTWGQGEIDGHRLFWTVHARNKKCVTLNLRTPRGISIFKDMVAQSDAVIENFRPGTLENWGIGPDVLHQENPRLVIARISGYGQDGPDALKPGYASVAEGVSGFRAVNGYPGQLPPRIALSLGDSFAGMFAVHGILAALIRSRTTGEGDVIDVALTESCLALMESTIPDFDGAGVVRKPSGTRLDGIAPSNVYMSRDGLPVIIAANQDTVFARLCGVMDRPELAQDEKYADHVARGRHQDELDDIVATWASRQTASDIVRTLDEAGVVCGPVNTVAEVVNDPQLIHREMFVDHDDLRVGRKIKGPGIVPKFSSAKGSVRWAGRPEPGFDNDDVYRGLLGLDDQDIKELTDSEVI